MEVRKAFLLLALGILGSLPQGFAILDLRHDQDDRQLTGGGFMGGGGGFLSGGGFMSGGNVEGPPDVLGGGTWQPSGGSWTSGGGVSGGGTGGWTSGRSVTGGGTGGLTSGGSVTGGGTGGWGTGRMTGVGGSTAGGGPGESILYPYGRAERDYTTPETDDGYSAEVKLTAPFTFFNKKYNSLFVNNNGVVSFGAPCSNYTPDAFPIKGAVFVAPFWGDVDVRDGGNVYYRESTKPDVLQRVSTDIKSYFPNVNFRATWTFIATWDKVAYFGTAYKRLPKMTNTFQAVLAGDSNRHFIILNYASITWTTGTASGGNHLTGLGGTAAQAGFNTGDLEHYFNIPGSRTSDIVNIASTSNVGTPGRWVFRVDKFTVPGGCVAGVNFAKFGDIFWKDDSCEEKCTCNPDGETSCAKTECSISEICKPTKWFFFCQAPESCI